MSTQVAAQTICLHTEFYGYKICTMRTSLQEVTVNMFNVLRMIIVQGACSCSRLYASRGLRRHIKHPVQNTSCFSNGRFLVPVHRTLLQPSSASSCTPKSLSYPLVERRAMWYQKKISDESLGATIDSCPVLWTWQCVYRNLCCTPRGAESSISRRACQRTSFVC